MNKIPHRVVEHQPHVDKSKVYIVEFWGFDFPLRPELWGVHETWNKIPSASFESYDEAEAYAKEKYRQSGYPSTETVFTIGWEGRDDTASKR